MTDSTGNPFHQGNVDAQYDMYLAEDRMRVYYKVVKVFDSSCKRHKGSERFNFGGPNTTSDELRVLITSDECCVTWGSAWEYTLTCVDPN